MTSGSFLLRRLGSGMAAVLGVCLLVFSFLHLIPGDPVDQLAGGEATQKQRDAIAHCMHLDESLPEQMVRFAGDILDGSLGHQCPNPEQKPTVMQEILAVLPYTVELAVASMLLALLLALPLGVLAAVRSGTRTDTAAGLLSLAGLSMPVMWMAPLLLGLFSVRLGWLPLPGDTAEPLALLLPAAVVGTRLMAMLARMTRASLIEVLRQDYMTTARAKGLSPLAVVFKHGLRNALLPVITVAGIQLGSLLGGAIIVEMVFARPGLGHFLIDAILTRNFPMVQGAVLVIAVSYVLVNLLVDVAYGIADPRIRHP